MVRTELVLPGPLTGDARVDRDRVLAALRTGRCRTTYGVFGSTDGYAFWHAPGDRSLGHATEGETATGPGSLYVQSPLRRSLHSLVRNGAVVARAEGESASFPCDLSGTYRVETSVYAGAIRSLRWGVRPWIYTNPIYVRGRATAQSRDSGAVSAASAVGGGTSRP